VGVGPSSEEEGARRIVSTRGLVKVWLKSASGTESESGWKSGSLEARPFASSIGRVDIDVERPVGQCRARPTSYTLQWAMMDF
jgi:hypothetical protein